MMTGFFIVDKPQGMTSFDVVHALRKLCREKKIGHTGTLDPMATGVLPVLLGRGTKAQNLLPDSSKEYLARFRLGLTTDTQDSTGKVLSQRPAHGTQGEIRSLLPQFEGEILQTPPMYSAVHQNGVRLYEYARQGIEGDRPKRPITVERIELQGFDEAAQEGTLLVRCSKGTYVRTLCADIGERLGCGAVLTALRRTAACGFSIKEAATLEELRALAEAGELGQALRPVEDLFACYPAVMVTAAQAIRFGNGGALALGRLRPGFAVQDKQLLRLLTPSHRFLGLGEVDFPQQEVKVRQLFLLPEDLQDKG